MSFDELARVVSEDVGWRRRGTQVPPWFRVALSTSRFVFDACGDVEVVRWAGESGERGCGLETTGYSPAGLWPLRLSSSLTALCGGKLVAVVVVVRVV